MHEGKLQDPGIMCMGCGLIRWSTATLTNQLESGSSKVVPSRETELLIRSLILKVEGD